MRRPRYVSEPRTADTGLRRRGVPLAVRRASRERPMNRRTRGVTTGTAPVPVPRDVEAVEAVIDALDAGVSDAAEAHRTIVTTLARELGLDYGAAWMVDADGGFSLGGRERRLRRRDAGRPDRAAHARRGAGRPGDQVPGRRPGGRDHRPGVLRPLEDRPVRRRHPRLRPADAGRERQGRLPLRVLQREELPFFGGRASKWRSLRGVLGARPAGGAGRARSCRRRCTTARP